MIRSKRYKAIPRNSPFRFAVGPENAHAQSPRKTAVTRGFSRETVAERADKIVGNVRPDPVRTVNNSLPTNMPGAMTKRRRAAPLFLLLGALFLGVGVLAAHAPLRLKHEGIFASGVVVALAPHRSNRDKTVEHAVVRFTPANSTNAIEFEDSAGSNPPMYRVGETVRVSYLTSSPAASAIIDHGVWNLLPAFLLGSCGALCLAAGLSLWLRQRSPASRSIALRAAVPMSRPVLKPSTANTLDAPSAPATLVPPLPHQRLVLLLLFVIGFALLFAPPPGKTGNAALGAFLYLLVGVIAVLGTIADVIASVMLAGLQAAAAVKSGTSQGMDVGESTSAWMARANDSSGLRALLLRYTNVKTSLWTGVTLLLLLSILLMASEPLMYLIGRMH